MYVRPATEPARPSRFRPTRLLPRSLRSRLVLVASAPLAATAALLVATGLAERDRASDAVRKDAVQLAEALAGRVSTQIRSADEVLVTLANVPGISVQDPDRCSARLRAVLPRYRGIANLAYADRDGRVRCSARAPRGGFDVSRRTFFRSAQGSGSRTGIGEFGGDPTTRTEALVVGRATGRGRSPVLFAALDRRTFHELVAGIELPGQAVAGIVDRRARLLARSQESGRFVGTTIPRDPEALAAVRRGSGTVEFAGADGVRRLYAVAAAAAEDGEPVLAAGIGLSRAAAFAPIERRLARNLEIFAVIALTALGAVWLLTGTLVTRPIGRLATASRRISEGDLTARVADPSDTSEIGDLARAFNAMAGRLQHTASERRDLMLRLLSAEESERQRLAADVHDDSIGAMSAVRIELELLEAELRDPAARRRIAEVDEAVGQAIARLRELLFELHPPELEANGLEAALRSYCGAMHDRCPWISCDVRIDVPEDLPQGIAHVVYRLCLEALANIRRHANARRVEFEVRHDRNAIHVRIADDGRGFDPSAANGQRGHAGLLAMRQRAELARGRLRIRSAPGAGTTVECRIPLERAGEPAAGSAV